MDKKTYQNVKAIATLGWIALDVLDFYKNGRKQDAKMAWNQLVGAARIFAIAYNDDNPNPVQTHAIPTLRDACESFGIDPKAVWDYLRK